MINISCRIILILLLTAASLLSAGTFSEEPGEISTKEPALHAHVPGSLAPEERRKAEPEPAKGRFLVATPELTGSIFEESVILLVDYSWHGVTGLIINKPAGATASGVFPEIKELTDHHEDIYLGGPVEIGRVSLLIKSGSKPIESEDVLPDLYFSLSIKALKEAATSREKGLKFRMYAGYAGWSAGQLTREILRGSWYVMEADQDVIFSEIPSLIWQKLIRQRSPFYDTVLRDADRKIAASGLQGDRESILFYLRSVPRSPFLFFFLNDTVDAAFLQAGLEAFIA